MSIILFRELLHKVSFFLFMVFSGWKLIRHLVGKEETISDSESTYSLSTFLTTFFFCLVSLQWIFIFVNGGRAGIQENVFGLGGNAFCWGQTTLNEKSCSSYTALWKMTWTQNHPFDFSLKSNNQWPVKSVTGGGIYLTTANMEQNVENQTIIQHAS